MHRVSGTKRYNNFAVHAESQRFRPEFTLNRFRRPTLLTLFAGLFAGFACNAKAQIAPIPLAPELRVEFFGAEKGYAVGMQQTNLLCVVRNVGTALLPEDVLRLRCYALTGFEYTSGDTWPTLSALAPGRTVGFRWTLAPTESRNLLMAAALLQGSEAKPHGTGGPKPVPASAPVLARQATLNVIPHFASIPQFAPPGNQNDSLPQVVASPDTAWVGNDRVGARFVIADSGDTVLLFGGKNGAAWSVLAIGTPLFAVRSGEDGQVPWWQSFRWEDSRVRSEKENATLILRGSLGNQWRGELQLEATRGTAAMQGTLRLTARRPMRLYGLQLPRLLATDDKSAAPGKADGTPFELATNLPVLPEKARIAAARTDGSTFGLTWPATFPFANWSANRLPDAAPPFLTVLGAAWSGAERGTVILPGATIVIPFRLFAYAPSDTLRDALRFLYPDTP